MKKLVMALSLISFNVFAGSTMDIPIRAIIQVDAFRITASSLNCRKGPGKEYKKLKRFKRDGIHETTRKWKLDSDDARWMEFYYNNDGDTCWARASYKYMRPTLFVQSSLEREDLLDLVSVCRSDEFEFDLEIDLFEGRAKLYFSKLNSNSEETLTSEKYFYGNRVEAFEFSNSNSTIGVTISGNVLKYNVSRNGNSTTGQCHTYFFEDSFDTFFLL
ncbi:hypothetical protein A9Q84_16350 [Halobacteriovorax marinus]|uniref:Secreted protein n=1 Tax=Halobacteriovorax marinus TaxID=97084 RepID=A0A1Y5F4K8_9BACT|nr:hypothetical protein A9Q84_16350 [Halobacteriovorax marinus]